MIGLDTNVLVRYIVRDDARQTAAATRLIESRCTAKRPGRVALVALCELVWVLDRGYGYERGQIVGVLERLLAADDLSIEHSERAWQAMGLYRSGRADFSDYVIGIANREAGVEETFSFDRRVSSDGPFRLVE